MPACGVDASAPSEFRPRTTSTSESDAAVSLGFTTMRPVALPAAASTRTTVPMMRPRT